MFFNENESRRYYHSERKEAPHVLCEHQGGCHRSEPCFVGGGVCAWCALVCCGEGRILTCLLKEDPIVQSLHRWVPRRKEEGRREERKVVISSWLCPHCGVILALLAENQTRGSGWRLYATVLFIPMFAGDLVFSTILTSCRVSSGI